MYNMGAMGGDIDDAGYSGYYSELDDPMSNAFGMGAIAGLTYTPNLGDVGHGATYYPGDVSADANALVYLGYPAGTPGGGNGQQADMAAQAGAWNPQFRQAVSAFQGATGVTQDGWIGPQTRSDLATHVAAKNAQESPLAPPFQPPNPSNPGTNPLAMPGSDPNANDPNAETAPVPGANKNLLYLGIAAAVVGAVGLYYVMK